jgi:hypothetical protein
MMTFEDMTCLVYINTADNISGYATASLECVRQSSIYPQNCVLT